MKSPVVQHIHEEKVRQNKTISKFGPYSALSGKIWPQLGLRFFGRLLFLFSLFWVVWPNFRPVGNIDMTIETLILWATISMTWHTTYKLPPSFLLKEKATLCKDRVSALDTFLARATFAPTSWYTKFTKHSLLSIFRCSLNYQNSVSVNFLVLHYSLYENPPSSRPHLPPARIVNIN
jgi:hypothetical protein